MQRITLSLALIAIVGGALAFGATTAFFSDTETSVGNTFAAGALDLKVDNESYYNGNVCAVDEEDIDDDQNTTEFVWQGDALFPVAGTDCDTSWELDDLSNGHLFFNFPDLKPDDEGEDTISLHVQNDAYACMELTLTSDDDKSSTEPELGDGDVAEDALDFWDGELAQNIQMLWWADDGDNVLEEGEDFLTDGVQTLEDLATTSGSFKVTLADSDENVWGEDGPLPAEETKYIAKAWCLGTLTPAPLPEGQGENPSVASGIVCDGTLLDNTTQTDGATLDISFATVQARHNDEFQCEDESIPESAFTLVKQVAGDPGEDLADPSEWTLTASGTTGFSGPGPVVLADPGFVPGTYDLSESAGPDGYTPANQWSCVGNTTVMPDGDTVTVLEGESVTCTIVNRKVPACNATADVMLVLDRSGSISGSEQVDLENAAHAFVDTLSPGNDGAHIGQTSFSTLGSLDQTLTGVEQDAHDAIDALVYSGFTNLYEGLNLARLELEAAPNDREPDTDDEFPDIVVVITDGNPNEPGDDANARAVAAAEADLLRAHGVEVFVVGVGADVDATFLESDIADNAAHYFPVANFEDLELALITIANCGDVPSGTLTIEKTVVGGDADESDFDFFADGDPIDLDTPTEVAIGSYLITEDGPDNYVATFGGDCDADGNVTVPMNGDVTCEVTNTFVAPGTLTVTKSMVNNNTGDDDADDFSFFVDGNPITLNTPTEVSAGVHTVTETGPNGYTATFGTDCDSDGDVNVPSGGSATCSITNDDNAPETVFASSFGTTGVSDVPDWEEMGGGTVTVTAGSGDDSASPDGGAFALAAGANGWICRVIPAGYSDLSLKYYARGDGDAEDNENGRVQYATSGTCGAATWTTVASHELDDGANGGEVWTTLQASGLPNTATLVRFFNEQGTGNEDFRIDGISLTGIPN